MQFEIAELENGIKQATLVGRLDLKGTNEIDDSFTFQISSAKAPVIVDMSGVEFLASIGIRMLLSSARALSRRGGKMVLLSPTPMVEEVLVTAGIDELIEIYNNLDSARAALASITVE
jgi:anti-anti-sigma factor